MPQQALRLANPNPDSTYRIALNVPIELQCIEIEALPVGIPLSASIGIYVDGERIGAFDEPPYALMWQLQPGEHRLHAQARGPSGETWSSEPVRITVLQ